MLIKPQQNVQAKPDSAFQVAACVGRAAICEIALLLGVHHRRRREELPKWMPHRTATRCARA